MRDHSSAAANIDRPATRQSRRESLQTPARRHWCWRQGTRAEQASTAQPISVAAAMKKAAMVCVGRWSEATAGVGSGPSVTNTDTKLSACAQDTMQPVTAAYQQRQIADHKRAQSLLIVPDAGRQNGQVAGLELRRSNNEPLTQVRLSPGARRSQTTPASVRWRRRQESSSAIKE